MKGFQKGHITTQETRDKISRANDGNFHTKCDYCGSDFHTKRRAFARQLRHFCCVDCYSKYRKDILPKEEQPRYGSGYSQEERTVRRKARSQLNHHLRDKNISRQACEVCGVAAEAHHDDYSKPLEVRWLCFRHHREWHKTHDNPELLEVTK